MPSPGKRDFQSDFVRSKYFVLLLSLIFFVFSAPLIGRVPGLKHLSNVAYVLVFGAGITVVSRNRNQRRTAWGLLAVSLFFTLLHGWVYHESAVVSITAVACYGVFFAYYIRLIIRDLLGSRHITGDTVCGAVCAYMLIAFNFAIIAQIVLYFDPSAYSLSDGAHASNQLLYFSFMTQTTVGFGDILPVSALARNIAMVQSVLGAFYMAVLVARLVGNMMTNRVGGNESE